MRALAFLGNEFDVTISKIAGDEIFIFVKIKICDYKSSRGNPCS